MRSQTAILLRKVGGKAVALFSNRSYLGLGFATSARTAGPLAAVGTFAVIMFLPLLILALLAVMLAAGHADHSLALATVPLVTVKSLREKRANLHEQAQAVLAKPEAEKREMNTEETQSFDAIHKDIQKLGEQIDRYEKQEKVGEELDRSRGVVAGREDRRADPAAGDDEPDTDKAAAKRAAAIADAQSAYLRNGLRGVSEEQRKLLRFNSEDGGIEFRAPQTVTTTGGGYLIKQDFSGKLEESMKQWGGVEQAATLFETETGATLPYPTVDDTAVSGAMLAINTQIAEQIVTYGVVNYAAYKMTSKLVLVPVELAQDAAFDLDSHLASVLGTRLGRIHNSYQTTGTGSSEPGGIVTGSSSALTAASATVVTLDELLTLEHAVDPAYRNPAFGAAYMFNDGTLLKLRQLKDGEGRPAWQPGIALGVPNTINGFPYIVNQDMAASTTGLKPILFGAIKKFLVRRVKGITVLRLVERYADYHQVGYVAFSRFDSKMLDAGTDPCKYITMA